MGYKVWDCQVVMPDDVELPFGADSPPRVAVSRAILEMLGREPIAVFSGWGGTLTPTQIEVVEESKHA